MFVVAVSTADDEKYATRGCNFAVDRTFICTIVEGTLRWDREMGGKYCCTASPQEFYYVHWINPGSMHVGNSERLAKV